MYKFYNIYFITNNFIIKKKFQSRLRKISIIYIICLFLLQNITYFFNRSNLLNKFIIFHDLFQVITSIFIIMFLVILLGKKSPENITGFYIKAFDSAYEKKNENIIGICENSYLNKVYNLPGSGEDCPICLKNKNINVQHCNICNKCVNDFYFHSLFYDLCINRDNAPYYCLLNLFLVMKQFSLISIIGSNTQTYICISTIMYSFGIILVYKNILFKIIGIYLFLSSFINLGKVISIIICLGFNSSYYLAYRSHKIFYGKLVNRKIHEIIIDYLSPVMNSIRAFSFISNIINRQPLENIE